MSQMVPAETTHGYTPPSVRQFSVFLENKVGRLLELVRLFDEDPLVHLCSISVLESSDHAVVRLIANNADRAAELFRQSRIPCAVLDLLVVELDEPDSFSSLCLNLLRAELNIRFAYPLLLARDGQPLIALAVDDHILAGQILRRKNFRLLGEADLD
ncbi:MAG: acetolactate synthase [Planctomycetota bacterium]|jgi:hypothetical protein